MTGKEIKPSLPPVHHQMSNYEWSLRFQRYALQYREFNTEESSLLDLVLPPRDKSAAKQTLTSSSEEDQSDL